jgi:hypothetical protein
MAFATSTISFGAYVFPASFSLVSRDQPAVIDEVKIPFLDGTNAPAGTRSSKTITLNGTIGGPGAVDSAGNLLSNRDQVEAEANLMSSYLESGYQQLEVGAGNFSGTPRYIMAQKRKSTFTYVEGMRQSVIGVEIEFLAQDPRWLAVTPTAIPAASSLNATYAVGGSGITYPVFTFTGGYVNPVVSVSPAGTGGSITLSLTAAMGGGDVVVIDCDPRNRANGVLLNGVRRLDLVNPQSTNTTGGAEFFPYLLPGGNVITASGSPNGSHVAVSWREAYLF